MIFFNSALDSLKEIA